jgi:WD40 repeat protein
LKIERRFERHREDVSWISVDTTSERGAGRLVVSYDAGSTAIVWDLLTGDEVARFASYEQIRVATWMRNGNVAFGESSGAGSIAPASLGANNGPGNAQGNIILFEPSTSEHLSARTIFDPITALAPASDCRTFAVGYLNGSILIATLQPSFTILHTLTTPRQPSPIAGLAWHGSSSKQKSEMLAAQTSDGDLRVWSVPKAPHGSDAPCVIRVLNQKEQREPGPCWFAWSKNGRIVQYTEGYVST